MSPRDFSEYRHFTGKCLENDIPFASYRLPGEDTIRTVIQVNDVDNKKVTARDLTSKSGFVLFPFHHGSSAGAVRISQDIAFEGFHPGPGILKMLVPGRKVPDPGTGTGTETDFTLYSGQVESILQLIRRGIITKAVLSRIIFHKKFSHFNEAEMFRLLLLEYPEAFVSLAHVPGNGTWIGATPETFLRVKEKQAVTMALAGTVSDETGSDFSAKENEEQEIVAGFIRRLAGKYGIRSLKPEQRTWQKAGHLRHLKTLFTFPAEELSGRMGEFIEELHPTPAVCGFPQGISKQIILETEQQDREYYSGFLGPVYGNGEFDLFVNLRCMKVLSGRLALFAGGGIVSGSDALLEWNETCLKAQTILSVLEKMRTFAP